ncbi:hypothetical protein EV368DRAFT_70168 [Lentinula lateritia]|nr:hypothetical protein EV368DRAFT_70168 [Lentinula lateritia]
MKMLARLRALISLLPLLISPLCKIATSNSLRILWMPLPLLLKADDESLKNSAAKRKNISEKDSSNTKDMDIDEKRQTEPHKRAKMNKETTAVIAKTKPPPASVKIDFIISLQKLDQLNKLATKRKPFGVRSFDLEQTDDWDTLKLELIKITEKSFPNKLIDLEQYEISYTIPRKSSNLSLKICALIDFENSIPTNCSKFGAAV